MTDALQATGDAALAWFRRNLAALVSVAAAIGFARAEFVGMQATLEEARAQIAALHKEITDLRVSGVGADRDALASVVRRQLEVDRRQDEELRFLRGRLMAVLAERHDAALETAR